MLFADPFAQTEKPELWSPGINNDNPLNQGLFGYWPFWEGGSDKIHDVGGLGNHGTMTSMLPKTDWRKTSRGYVLNFDSSNDHVRVNVKSLDSLSPNMTIAVGVTPNSITVGEYISDFQDGNVFALVKGYQSGFYNVYGGAYPSLNVAGNTQIPASGNGIRDLVIWTKFGDNLKGYVNGVLGTDVTITTGVWTPALPAFDIGAKWPPVGSAAFGGQIDFYAIWSRALTQAEVLELYSNPYGLITPHRKVFIQ